MRDKLSERAKEEAEEAVRAGDFGRARGLYERALDGTEKSAEIHYRLGLLCDDRLGDLVGAYHHYGRYLEFVSSGAKASEIKRLRAELKKRLGKEGEDGSLLAKEVARLKNENQTLRNETVKLRARLEGKPLAEEAKKGKPAKPGSGRSYTVQDGDTLAAISRKFFGTSTRWKDIQDANFQQLGGGVNLKPGQALIIPDP